MRLYRYKTIMTHSYQSPVISGTRLESAVVDPNALNGLSRLINGGIRSIEDLKGAEAAIRAMIFHELLVENIPVIDVQIQNSSSPPPGWASIEPELRDAFHKETGIRIVEEQPHIDSREDVSVILGNESFRRYRCCIDHLYAFEGDESEMIAEHNRSCKAKSVDPSEQGFFTLFSADSVELEVVSENTEEFFANRMNDRKLVDSYLKPISASGMTPYLSLGVFTERKNEIANNILPSDICRFFPALDADWEEYNRKLSRTLDIPMPLFLSIVLSMSRSRVDITESIRSLRDDFRDARRELWEIIDDAELRISDSHKLVGVMDKLEREAASIVPRIIKRNDFYLHKDLGFIFDILGRLKDLIGLGLNPAGAIQAGAPLFRLEASRKIEKHLFSLEIRGLLVQFLSDTEIRSIGSNS
ncbi:MAG: hypothetical protein LAT61_10765 [Alcanivorax sp.]|nr:hypothetical protein [Alcanivorax sp.]